MIVELCPQNHPCPTLKVCPVGAIQQVGFAAPTVNNDNVRSDARFLHQSVVVGLVRVRDLFSTLP